MLLAIDVGNTNIVFAFFDDDGAIVDIHRVETQAPLEAAALSAVFDFDAIKGVVISSVVPEVDGALELFCQEHLNCAPVFVTKDNVGIEVDLERPEEVGADRLVNAAAVTAQYETPAIVLDFGTATTFDVIDERGAYTGGVIAPGIHLSAQALHAAAAKLPQVEPEKPDQVIGKDTKSAMQSGLYWGYAALIEGVIIRLVEEMGERAEREVEPFVIATGGLARVYAQDIPVIDAVDPQLTLRGLYQIYKDMK